MSLLTFQTKHSECKHCSLKMAVTSTQMHKCAPSHTLNHLKHTSPPPPPPPNLTTPEQRRWFPWRSYHLWILSAQQTIYPLFKVNSPKSHHSWIFISQWGPLSEHTKLVCNYTCSLHSMRSAHTLARCDEILHYAVHNMNM